MNPKTAPAPVAATDVQQLLADLDAGNLERSLSVALSKVAAAVVDYCATGEVIVKFKIKAIPGSHQIGCEHTVDFKCPTEHGTASERMTRTTVLFVGQFGKLTLAQPPLPGMKQRDLPTD